jgi:hypothetical protein
MIVVRLSSDGFLGWMKLHEALLHSLPLQVKFAQIFSGMTFGKNIGWVDRWTLEVKHTQILPLLGGCIDLHASLRLLLLLTIGRIGVAGRIRRSGRAALVFLSFFRTRLGIGSQFSSQ